ncbi:MAG: hypothetical protein K2Y39_27625 [Candidatus Obscuribacterales bacterium]|nr:hypothetical protein [Candidatus Obscuribacterales bacterium]
MDFLRTIILQGKINWFLFKGDYNRAIPNLSELLRLRKKRLGNRSIEDVPNLLLLAHCFHNSGNNSKFMGAIFIYMEAQEIALNAESESKDLMLGKIAVGMGQWYAAGNHTREAEESFKAAIEAFSRCEGIHSLRLLEPLYGRIAALRQLGRKDEAEPLEKWTAQIEAAQRYMDQYAYHGHYPRF